MLKSRDSRHISWRSTGYFDCPNLFNSLHGEDWRKARITEPFDSTPTSSAPGRLSIKMANNNWRTAVKSCPNRIGPMTRTNDSDQNPRRSTLSGTPYAVALDPPQPVRLQCRGMFSQYVQCSKINYHIISIMYSVERGHMYFKRALFGTSWWIPARGGFRCPLLSDRMFLNGQWALIEIPMLRRPRDNGARIDSCAWWNCSILKRCDVLFTSMTGAWSPIGF